MKCPICNDGKIITNLDGTYECDNPECSIYDGTHTETFETLIRTRKALDVAVDAIKSAKVRLELINNSKFANLNNVLQIQSQCEVLKINKALDQVKQITETKE